MPENTYIQYGSFGIIVFLVIWFVIYGFPKMMETVTTAVSSTLVMISSIEEQCRNERVELLRAFREECELNRKFTREESDADRKARHDQGVFFQQCLAEMGLTRLPKKP